MHPAKSSPGPAVRRVWLAAAALGGLALAVFAPALDCDFVNLDDPGYVTGNTWVKRGLSAEGFRWAFTTYACANWHPLTWLSLQLDASLWKGPDGRPDPFGFHLTNVLLHAGSTALLFLALRALTGCPWPAAAAALLFAVHPLRAESVAWVAERKDVLSTFFGLAALLAYAGYARRPAAGRYLAVATAFGLSLLCKQMLVTLPFLLLVLDWWPLGRAGVAGAWRRLAAEKLPLVALAAAFSAIAYRAQSVGGGVIDSSALPAAIRLANAALSYVTYVAKTFWPLNLAVFYPYRAYPWGAGLPPALVAGSVLLLATVTATAVALRRRAPYLLAGWLWYLGTLVPVIGLVQIGDQAYADRYSYFPQVGILIALSWGAADLARGRRAPALVAAAAAVLALVALTRWQLAVWRDSVTLWEHDLRTAGRSPLCLTDLGVALEEAGRPDEAEEKLREALRLETRACLTHINLANLCFRQGRLEEAAAEFQTACELQPTFAEPLSQLAEVRLRQNRADEAAKLIDQALRLNPDLATAYCHRGLIEVARGKLDDAAASFREALRFDPDLAEAHSGLGNVLLHRHREAEGFAELREAIRCNPRFGEGYLYLAVALEQRHDFGAAARNYDEAVRCSPGLATAWFGLGKACLRERRLPDAVACLRKASELEPGSAEYRSSLARAEKLLATTGQATPR
jgi:tetratricopeptide (TPR) repeat protein